MEYTKVIQGEVCKIKMRGKFSFADHIEFKKIFTVFNENAVETVEIDMHGVDFIDSAALGLLLLARDEAEKKQKTLVLVKPRGQVDKMFRISRFYELFKIIN